MLQAETSQSFITNYNAALDPMEYLVGGMAFTYYLCPIKIAIKCNIVEKIWTFFTDQSETQEYYIEKLRIIQVGSPNSCLNQHQL